MSAETGLIGLAWAILFLVLACMAPRALWRTRHDDEEQGSEELFLDIGGPVIEAELA